MAAQLLFFDGDGMNVDNLAAWNDDESKGGLTLYFVGGSKRVIGSAGPQAKAFQAWVKTVGMDLKTFVPPPVTPPAPAP